MASPQKPKPILKRQAAYKDLDPNASQKRERLGHFIFDPTTARFIPATGQRRGSDPGSYRRSDPGSYRGSDPGSYRGSASRNGRGSDPGSDPGSGPRNGPENSHGSQGVMGFGLSYNNPLDLICILVLACIGIFIKLFCSEPNTRLGNSGPATSTIWGYGLTTIALTIMIFVGIYQSKKITLGDKIDIQLMFLNTFPIIITIFVLIYTIFLNFSYFIRINSDKVTSEYRTYSIFSSSLTLVQIVFISIYLYFYIYRDSNSKSNFTIEMFKNLTYISCFANIIFILMMHINLAFFSTDEVPITDTD
jgi:hypothetical protein